MDPSIMIGLASLIIGGYVISVIVRYRKERQAKAAGSQEPVIPPKAPVVAPTLPPPTAPAGSMPATPSAPSTASTQSTPSTPPTASGPGARTMPSGPAAAPGSAPSTPPTPPMPAAGAWTATNVAELVAGARLPDVLVPFTSAVTRAEALDRVVFLSDDPRVDDLAAQVLGALAAIGLTVTPAGTDRWVATSAHGTLQVALYGNGPAAVIEGVQAFPTAPEGSTVVDLWIAAPSP